jgi:hypothetical protein
MLKVGLQNEGDIVRIARLAKRVWPSFKLMCVMAIIVLGVATLGSYSKTVLAGPTNTFSGTLKDQNGVAFPSTTIRLKDTAGHQYSATTAANGSFSVVVDPGMYHLYMTASNSNGLNFTLEQDPSTPSIDLTSNDVIQDLVIPTATVTTSLYNAQGYSRNGYVQASTASGSVSLYSGGVPATTVSITMPSPISTNNGAVSFKSIVGMTYDTTNSSNEVCAYTSSSKTALIGCNTSSITVASGTNNLDLPNTPAPRNTFTGTLKDQNGASFPSGITIRLSDVYGNQVSATTASGSFSISVEPGMYSLYISASGNSNNSNGFPFTLSQDTSASLIDLTGGSIVQNLVIPVNAVSIALYNEQDYPRNGYV